MNASVHVSDDHGADVFVLDGSFKFVISTCSITVEHGVVLEVAFTTLIANGTVQRMVDKQELHDTASSESGWFGVCVNFHGGGDLRAAAGNGFG